MITHIVSIALNEYVVHKLEDNGKMEIREVDEFSDIVNCFGKVFAFIEHSAFINYKHEFIKSKWFMARYRWIILSKHTSN